LSAILDEKLNLPYDHLLFPVADDSMGARCIITGEYGNFYTAFYKS